MTFPEDAVILADTSIWIDHFRYPNQMMRSRLNDSLIVTHPLVLGELALGWFADRRWVLAVLDRLPQVSMARESEVRQLVENSGLFNKGIGWVDAHLIASSLIDAPTRLWTADKRLARAASEIGIQLHPNSLPN